MHTAGISRPDLLPALSHRPQLPFTQQKFAGPLPLCCVCQAQGTLVPGSCFLEATYLRPLNLSP